MRFGFFEDNMVDRCTTLITIPEIPEHYKFSGKFLEFEVVCAPSSPSGVKPRSPKFRCHGNRFSTPSLSTNQHVAGESPAANPTMSMSTINVPRDKRHFGSPGGSNNGTPRTLTSLSQPCLPVCVQGPTKILPFLYLGSQQDVMDQETLKKYGIDFVVNLSTSCPKPDHLKDEHFLRIPVQDSYTEVLLPYFEQAFQFLDMVREASGVALIHCLAGISRSPTLAIAYVMRYLHMKQEEAYRYVKEKRPSISPNFNFLGQLLQYERYLEATRLNRKNSISLKSSPSVESTKICPSFTIGRPTILLPKSSLYPDLSAQSPDSSPKGAEQANFGTTKLFKLPDSDSTPVLHKNFDPVNTAQVSQCLSMDQWLSGRRVQTEILCRSPDSVDRAPAPICRSTLDLVLGALPVPFDQQLPKMARNLGGAPELPSPSTELSKLNFDSKQSPSSPKQPIKMEHFSNFSKTNILNEKYANFSNILTSKINPLFSTSTSSSEQQPIPPERRRKRLMPLEPAPMDCTQDEPPGFSGGAWTSEPYSTPLGCRRGGFETKIEPPEAVEYPFLDLDELKQNERVTFATNPMFGGSFAPGNWRPTPESRPEPCSMQRRPFKHNLKLRSSGWALRKFIRGSPGGRKLGSFGDGGRGFAGPPDRPLDGSAKHAKFSDLSKKFHDFLKSSRLHFSSLTNRGSLEPSTSLDCLSVGPSSSHKSPASTTTPISGHSKSQSICDMLSTQSTSALKAGCPTKFTPVVTTSSSSSSSVSNSQANPAVSGAKMDPKTSNSRRCSSGSLSKRSEKSHDCSENMGSSSSLEIAVN